MEELKNIIAENVEKNLKVNFANSDEDAERRYNATKSKDPFPKIEAALLNSADIVDYVAATGMIHPFKPTKKALKPASYEIEVGHDILYWTEDGEEVKELKKHESIPFKKNSITYVTILPKFQIPDYIALRFNLCIKHVHRGILLGTGPLVNPGFVGRIEIPIHNLTNNDYYIKPGEPLITVEFTKISKNSRWHKELSIEPDMQGVYIPNSKPKDLPPYEFVMNALPENIDKVQSSIGKFLSDTKEEVKSYKITIESVKKEHEKLIKQIQGIGGIGIIVLFITIVTLFIQTKSVVSDANKYVADASMLVKKNEKGDLDLRNFVVRDEIDLKNVAKQDELEALKNEIKNLNDKIDHFIKNQRVPVEKSNESH
jgi:deoxycytidine triphosphate deaminase